MNRRPCSSSASRGAIQIEFDRFAPVVGERLIGRRERQKEMRIEALGQKGRGDPAGEGNERVGRGNEALARHELGEGRAAVERSHALCGNEPRLARGPCEQHAAFLERLADRGDPQGPRGRVDSVVEQRALDRASSASAASSRPPGKTSAPEAKSISWWRTTMKVSRPAGPSRMSRMVEAARAAAGAGFAAHARSRSPQAEALDLAGRGLRQFRDELDRARIFVWREPVLDEGS